MERATFTVKLLKPRYWLYWLVAGFWFLLAQMPYAWQMWLARLLAPLLFLNKKRLHYAEINIKRCFPHLSESEREILLRKNVASTLISLFETGIAWFWPSWRLRTLLQIEGLEHLQKAQKEGVGILLLTTHFTTIDMGCALLGLEFDYDGLYRAHQNPVYDYLQRKGRESYCRTGTAIPRERVRTMISHLRKGRAVWYAPDRDLGPEHSIFVPFFGVPAATITATSKIAAMGRARVIPFTQVRLANNKGYKLTIHEPLTDFPSDDVTLDALRINQFMEREVKKCPEQYFWAQPRFKTRPEGEPAFYKY